MLEPINPDYATTRHSGAWVSHRVSPFNPIAAVQIPIRAPWYACTRSESTDVIG
jgi:hypothetical protein